LFPASTTFYELLAIQAATTVSDLDKCVRSRAKSDVRSSKTCGSNESARMKPHSGSPVWASVNKTLSGADRRDTENGWQ
jgi:hypothetical protein